MGRKTSLIILILVSIAVHFAFFGHPNETVFDEVHFGKFVSAYYTHEYYFDIHPPGGKLIIAGFASLFGFTPEHSFAEIGQPFPNNMHLVLRFLPIMAGLLLPVIIYFLALELGFSGIGAFGAGMFIALENALLTQSRYILLDPFLFTFGFATLLFYFRWRRTRQARELVIMAVFGGLAASIKWTGLTFIGLAGLIEFLSSVRAISFRHLVRLGLYFILVPFLVYYSIFAVHFSILDRSGEGDAFMTPEFQRTLQNSLYGDDENTRPLNTFEKFMELNGEMYRANQTLTATHPYSSEWYTWPFMTRAIYYWNQSSTTEPTEAKIYLIGNPVIWWASTVAILYLLLSSLGRGFLKDKVALFLLAGYFVNFLPFMAIGRVMFLYHYLVSLVFAILAFTYLVDRQRNRNGIFMVVIGIAAISFIFFSPLSYGLHLEAGSFTNRMWLNTWR